MAILVVFMASVFYTISHGYLLDLFHEYANAAEQGEAAQWARSLAYYYESNGDSWSQANDYVEGILQQTRDLSRANHVESVIVYDTNHRKVIAVGDDAHQANDVDASLDKGQSVSYPIVVQGKTIGDVQVSDTGLKSLSVVEESVLHSMAIATFWGGVLTSIVALLIGAWFARRLTVPLQHLLKAIEQIARGERTTRVSIRTNDEFGRVGQSFNEMTERLFQTEEARRHLVADVAHELRTPLTIMQGQLELIQEGVRAADQATMLPILDEVMRLSRLVEDLHQLSLAEVGGLTLEKHETNLVSLVQRIVDNFSIEAEDKSIVIAFHASVEEAIAVVDGHRIAQVFVNLLGNALRYTPSAGTVDVEMAVEDKWVTISVKDTGNGIEPRHLAHIFDRFYRADGDRSRETGGMGIGLAIAKEYVEAHRGQIAVASQVGQGSTFKVRLPREL